MILLAGSRLGKGVQVSIVGFIGACTLVFEIFLLRNRNGRRWLWLAWLLQGLVGLSAMAIMPANVTGRALEQVPYLSRFSSLADGQDATWKVPIKIWRSVTDLIVSEQPLGYADGKKDSFHSLRKLIGYGPETLALASARFYKPARDISSRAHNEALDRVATTGFLGLLSYFFLIGVAFYHILKRLGMAGPCAGAALFLAINVLTTALGTLLPILLKRAECAGLGAMLGLASAVVIHAGIAAMRSPKITFDAPKLIALCLLTGLLAHFLEIAVGITSITSGAYFFILIALISQVAGKNYDAGGANLDVKNNRKKVFRDRASSRSSVAVAHEVAPYVFICAIIILLMDWVLVTDWTGLTKPLQVFWDAWTVNHGLNRLHEPGLWALGIVISGITIGALLTIAETSPPLNSTLRRSTRPFVLWMGAIWLAYALLLSNQLTGIYAATSAASISSRYGWIVVTLSVLLFSVLGCLAISVVRLHWRNVDVPRRVDILSAIFGLTLLALVLPLAYSFNLVAIQADVDAYLASRCAKQGDWDDAIFFTSTLFRKLHGQTLISAG